MERNVIKNEDILFKSCSIYKIIKRGWKKKYIEQNNLGKCEFFIDDGYSGGNFERPKFKDMINEIENGNISTVITKDTSRLGRDFIETSHYMFKYFPEHNIRYISILENCGRYDSISNNYKWLVFKRYF